MAFMKEAALTASSVIAGDIKPQTDYFAQEKELVCGRARTQSLASEVNF